MAHHPALIETTDAAFGLIIPDCPGCCAIGHSCDEVYENGVEALREWMTDRVAAGFPPPKPRDAFALRRDPALAEDFDSGSAIAMLPLLLDAGAEIPIDVSLDAGLLLQIDDAAKLRGISRSAFLAAAAREKIAVGR